MRWLQREYALVPSLSKEKRDFLVQNDGARSRRSEMESHLWLMHQRCACRNLCPITKKILQVIGPTASKQWRFIPSLFKRESLLNLSTGLVRSSSLQRDGEAESKQRYIIQTTKGANANRQNKRKAMQENRRTKAKRYIIQTGLRIEWTNLKLFWSCKGKAMIMPLN